MIAYSADVAERRGFQGITLCRLLGLVCTVVVAGAACGTSNQPLGAGVEAPAGSTSAASGVTTTAGGETLAGETAESSGTSESQVAQSSSPVSEFIVVDQFGYFPTAAKVAVLIDPEVGFNADGSFTPSASIELRDAATDGVVFSAPAEPWAGGDIHEQSGDRGAWFDFSEVQTAGSYYVLDPDSGDRSATFDISAGVYDEVFDAALKAFWFNRANVEHSEEFGGPWNDRATYVREGQDGEARSVDTPDDPSLALDLTGGWFDAGDTNKYVTFATEPVHLLLRAYHENPEVFSDAVGIPESGNGIPDVIDEVHWEIEWLEKMQRSDGAVLTKVGILDFSRGYPPSESYTQRFYEEVCSSAAITAAGMFAHAALVFGEFELFDDDVARLEGRAVEAWDWFEENPMRDNCDPQVVQAGDADMTFAEQGQEATVAAIYLWALTGAERYHDVIERGYSSLNPYLQDGFNTYAPHHGDALLYYRDQPGADPSIVRSIDARIAELVAESALYGFDAEADLYRAFMPESSYHWGSNRVKANVGFSNAVIGNDQAGLQRALEHLHYFHGVNPLGITYLSHMEPLGAERSVQQLHHFWFGEGTAFDRAAGSAIGTPPGYVVGGPNAFYSGGATPPSGQPAQKSYADLNDLTEPVWELTEPAIYYQASYVRLLAAVIAGGADLDAGVEG